jgi:hypothetical protein
VNVGGVAVVVLPDWLVRPQQTQSPQHPVSRTNDPPLSVGNLTLNVAQAYLAPSPLLDTLRLQPVLKRVTERKEGQRILWVGLLDQEQFHDKEPRRPAQEASVA